MHISYSVRVTGNRIDGGIDVSEKLTSFSLSTPVPRLQSITLSNNVNQTYDQSKMYK